MLCELFCLKMTLATVVSAHFCQHFDLVLGFEQHAHTERTKKQTQNFIHFFHCHFCWPNSLVRIIKTDALHGDAVAFIAPKTNATGNCYHRIQRRAKKNALRKSFIFAHCALAKDDKLKWMGTIIMDRIYGMPNENQNRKWAIHWINRHRN